MAKPIKETPIINGKDAARFRENISRQNVTKVPVREMAQMKANYTKLMSISAKSN